MCLYLCTCNMSKIHIHTYSRVILLLVRHAIEALVGFGVLHELSAILIRLLEVQHIPLILCCSVLQCVAVRCSVSWGSARTQCDLHPAPRTSTHPTHTVFQCVAVCGSVLQCVAVSAGVLPDLTAILTGSSNINRSYSCCSVLQCAAVCCSVLQCAAVCCSALQCVAVSIYTCVGTRAPQSRMRHIHT